MRNMAEDLKSAAAGQERIAPLLGLADALQYSDPSAAPGEAEDALKGALDALDEEAGMMMASPDAERGERWEKVLRACVKAERALEARNAALLNSR